MSNKKPNKKLSLKEKLKLIERLIREPKPAAPPTSKQVITGMIGREVTLTPEEVVEERDAMTADNYDDWVMKALHDLYIRRIQAGECGKLVKHPLERLHKIGEESISEGKDSPLYLYFKELLAMGATLPVVTSRAMIFAQSQLDFKNAYLEHLKKHLEHPTMKHKKVKESAWEHGAVREPQISLREAKRQFKLANPSHSTDKIDDALKAHDLNYPANGVYSPRKEKRKRK